MPRPLFPPIVTESLNAPGTFTAKVWLKIKVDVAAFVTLIFASVWITAPLGFTSSSFIYLDDAQFKFSLNLYEKDTLMLLPRKRNGVRIIRTLLEFTGGSE